MHQHIPPLFLVLAAAVIAPLLAKAFSRLGLSIIVLELVLGVVIGPQGLGWASSDAMVSALATLGMAFLFFLAGTEIDLSAFQATSIARAGTAWLLSLGLGLGLAWWAAQQGWVGPWVIVGIVLSTTALGILVPILRDSGLAGSPLGTQVIGAGVVGELGPILLMSIALSQSRPWGTQSLLVLAFVLIVLVLSWVLAKRIAVPSALHFLQRSLNQASQLPVRVAILLLCLLSLLAEAFGLDLALGALAAGMIVAWLTRDAQTHVLHQKLDGIGFGFLVPVFFINSGMNLDVLSLVSSPSGLQMSLLFFVGIVLAHMPVALLARASMSGKESLALGLLSATTLSLIVAITEVAVRAGNMKPAEASPLIAAGVLSVTVMPLLAKALLPKAGLRTDNFQDNDGL